MASNPLNVMPGGIFDPSKDLSISGRILSNDPVTGGIGYSTGAGGTVTQITNRSTAVTINALCGTIVTINTSLAAEAAASFTVNNSSVLATDVVCVCQKSGAVGVMTDVVVIAVANGSFILSVMNGNVASGTAETGAISVNFVVLRSVTS